MSIAMVVLALPGRTVASVARKRAVNHERTLVLNEVTKPLREQNEQAA